MADSGKRISELPVYSYDQEADVLYISFAPGEQATAAVELNENILLRFNRDAQRAVGLTLMDFSVLAQLTALGPRSFALSGLQELEPDWQDEVIKIITSPLVNQILRVSAYAPSAVELIPIASVEYPHQLVAT